MTQNVDIHSIEVEGLTLVKAAEEFGYHLAQYTEGRVETLAAGVIKEIEPVVKLEKCLPTGVHNFISTSVEGVLKSLADWLAQHQPATGADQSKDRLQEAVAAGAPDSKDPSAVVPPAGDAGVPDAPDEANPSPETEAGVSTGSPDSPEPEAELEPEPEAGADSESAGRDDVPAEEPADAAPEGTVQA